MRRSSALLLTFLALTGCASERRPSGKLTVVPAPRAIVGVEVTNIFNHTIDVFSGPEFLGTLAPSAYRRYPLAPTMERPLLYARWAGQQRDQQFNIAHSRMVRYVYEEPALAGR